MSAQLPPLPPGELDRLDLSVVLCRECNSDQRGLQRGTSSQASESGGVTLSHPITGEVLPEDDARALREAYDAAWPVYRAAARIKERLAELEGYALPHPRQQTDKQRRISSCPRCGHKEDS